VDSRFIQVHPLPPDEISLIRSSGQTRAVILIHGLQIHPVSSLEVLKANFRSWQKAHSQFVEALALETDVYAFAYSENVPLERIVSESLLNVKISKLKDLGYAQIVLIGHSAGGLIARELVEDYPGCGVTKVIQICAPNAGTSVANMESSVRRIQRPFLHCLTKEGRAVCLQERADKRIPPSVQFVCVIADGFGSGDFLVSSASQWPRDLQDQGIPAVALHTNHFAIMHSKTQAQKIAEIVREDMPRWNESQVASMKKSLK
jgi:pimeloyl-ACP methyl ester carboxylesterase